MIEPSQLALFTVAAAAIVAAPGPDMLLVIGRALGQGRWAGMLAGFGCAAGVLATSVMVACGLAALLQASLVAFTVMKYAGAAYLIWLALQTLRERSLFTPQPAKPASARQIFVISLLGNLINPKVALFMFAFLPQFVDHRSDVPVQIMLLGGIYALLTIVGFTLLSTGAASLARVIERRPKVIDGLNIGAALVFFLSGLRIATFEQPR